MNLRLLYPGDPLDPRQPDPTWQEEFDAANRHGFACSVFPLEALGQPRLRARPMVNPGECVVYRGWMLDAGEYAQLQAAIEGWGAQPLTDTPRYLAAHHLPNWYDAVRDLTPETVVFEPDADLQSGAAALDWDGYFVKDFVKSLTTARGSIARSPAEVQEVADAIRRFRGKIEGGICLRQLERFVAGTERRYFVLDGRALASDGNPPDLVKDIAARLPMRFYSVDLAGLPSGALRLVEIGDGQVSDLKEWDAEVFVAILDALR